ncbi:MAG: LVIVD repeat-containing protein [Actinomycetota bacterium]
MRSRSRFMVLVLSLALPAGLLGPAQARVADDHTENFIRKAQVPIKIDKELMAEGSDLAFKDDLLIAGTYQGPAIFKMTKSKPFVKQIGFAYCPGGQGDVSVLGNYVFLSVDTALVGETCSVEDTTAAGAPQYAAGDGWEGVRIFDISNPTRPRWVASVDAPCGSHTHTLLPGKKTSYLYVNSYPISGQGSDCNYASHRQVQIIEFPTANPAKAKLLDETIDVSPALGCHDITTFPDRKIMAGACINQSMIWDIEDPTNPTLLSTIYNPRIQIHHSTAMTWDGQVLVLGDETGGAAAGGGPGHKDSQTGAAWFYDVSDPSNPTELGSHSYPRTPQLPAGPGEAGRSRWTNHNFNVIPLRNSDKYLLAVSYYLGGIAVVDFTDPANTEELAHYVIDPAEEGQQDTWSSYWYNGRIYTNDYQSRMGIGVYEFKGTTSPSTTHFFRGEMNPQVQFAGNLRR